MALLVSVEQVAAKLGVAAQTLSEAQRAQVESAIEDATAKVAAYLGRSLTVRTETVRDLYATPGFALFDYRCWSQVESHFNDRYEVAAVEVPSSGAAGFYDVTFAVGLDVAGDPELEPIVAFIKADAVSALRLDAGFGAVGRAVTSVSADGQSVTYEKAGSAVAAGAPQDLASLNRWRRRAAYARRTAPFAPWPYV